MNTSTSTANLHLISHIMNDQIWRRLRTTRRRGGRRRSQMLGKKRMLCLVPYMQLTWHVRVFADMADDVMAVQICCNAMFQLQWRVSSSSPSLTRNNSNIDLNLNNSYLLSLSDKNSNNLIWVTSSHIFTRIHIFNIIINVFISLLNDFLMMFYLSLITWYHYSCKSDLIVSSKYQYSNEIKTLLIDFFVHSISSHWSIQSIKRWTQE